jgi:hypothetical protein
MNTTLKRRIALTEKAKQKFNFYYRLWRSKEFADRVRELENEGLCTSDAQGAAQVELAKKHLIAA